ncbi:class I SAM-dependent methyltransferase [Rhodococcus sp. X156]|uniref:class I SAM-dependent methyltransferase n=1 Tax=Rhodococcus sp. X156 TaxID=2499145 RepID=UPI000FDA1CC3|nr:class I SAM-dependent methyltransferase [Rhodococcus sp. X156]
MDQNGAGQGPAPAVVEALPITGERTVPGIAEENYWFRRHEVAYLDLARHCAGRTVLEAGCGEGYGADLLSRSAARVVALDYDAHTAAHVGRRYPGLDVLRGNLAALPLRTASVEVVVNLQVIEHLWDQAEFLRECARVLAPGGVLLISTPNRITFSPGRDTPLNPFHTRELNADELAELLVEAGFTVQSMRGLHHGPRLRALDAAHGGSFIDAQLDRSLAGEAWPEQLVADVASISTDDFEIVEPDVDASLDLVAVAVRR